MLRIIKKIQAERKRKAFLNYKLSKLTDNTLLERMSK